MGKWRLQSPERGDLASAGEKKKLASTSLFSHYGSASFGFRQILFERTNEKGRFFERRLGRGAVHG
jgi:hypothetical protein